MNYKCGLTSKHVSTLLLQPLGNNGGKQNEKNLKKTTQPFSSFFLPFSFTLFFFLFFSFFSLLTQELLLFSLESLFSPSFAYSKPTLISYFFSPFIAKNVVLVMHGQYGQWRGAVEYVVVCSGVSLAWKRATQEVMGERLCMGVQKVHGSKRPCTRCALVLLQRDQGMERWSAGH